MPKTVIFWCYTVAIMLLFVCSMIKIKFSTASQQKPLG